MVRRCLEAVCGTAAGELVILLGGYRKDLGEILRQLCQWKGVEIIEGHLMPDHVSPGR